MEYLDLGSSLKTIGGQAFYGCSALTELHLPDSLELIKGAAFYGCVLLKSVYVSSAYNWLKIQMHDENPLEYADALYVNGELLTTLIVPPEITTINKNSFVDYEHLRSIVLSAEHAITIDRSAFVGKTNLRTVYYEGTAEQFNNLVKGALYPVMLKTTKYYYSEDEPTTSGNFWHYVDGVPTPW